MLPRAAGTVLLLLSAGAGSITSLWIEELGESGAAFILAEPTASRMGLGSFSRSEMLPDPDHCCSSQPTALNLCSSAFSLLYHV